MAKDLFQVVLLEAQLPAEVMTNAEMAWRARAGGFDTVLLEEGVFDEQSLQPYLERAWQLRNHLAPWSAPEPEAVRMISALQAARWRIVPLAIEGRVLEVLTADPGDVRSLDELAFYTGMRVSLNVGSYARVAHQLGRAYGLDVEHRLAMALAPRAPSVQVAPPEPPPVDEGVGPPPLTLSDEALRSAAAVVVAELAQGDKTEPRPSPPVIEAVHPPARSSRISGEYSIQGAAREEIALPARMAGVERRRPTLPPPVPGEPQPPTPMPRRAPGSTVPPPMREPPLDEPGRPETSPSEGVNPFAPRAKRPSRQSIPVIPARPARPSQPPPVADSRAPTLLSLDPPPLPPPGAAPPRAASEDFGFRPTELAPGPRLEDDNDLGRRIRQLGRAAELPPLLFEDLRPLLPRQALFCAVPDDGLWGWHSLGAGAISGVTFKPHAEGLLGRVLREGHVFAGKPSLSDLDEGVVVRLGTAPAQLILWPVLVRGQVAWIFWGEPEHAIGLTAAQDRLRGATAALSALAARV